MEATVAIRTDYSPQIGSGHYMRCRTLAKALQKRGCQVTFMFRYLPEFCQEELRREGFESFSLSTPFLPSAPLPKDYHLPRHASWLGVSSLEDAEACRMACSDRQPFDWLIVDHYSLDIIWEKATASLRRRLMVIDDLADRAHACDLLVDQNCYRNAKHRYESSVPASCLCLLGSQYAILREQFRMARKRMILRKGPVRRLLIFMGSSDSGNYTQKVLNALAHLRSVHPEHVEVIVSRTNAHLESLRAQCNRLGRELITDTPDMAEHMLLADAAIGAAGSTNLERFCMGLPAFVLSVAYNQEQMLEDCKAQGLLCAHEKDTPLEDALLAFLKDDEQREAISRRCITTVDGLGVDRILSAMQKLLLPQNQEQRV